jgi:hypothetical protein
MGTSSGICHDTSEISYTLLVPEIPTLNDILMDLCKAISPQSASHITSDTTSII